MVAPLTWLGRTMHGMKSAVVADNREVFVVSILLTSHH